ncbi:MAG: phenylacetic acid degradation protein [Bacteroidetes bacterium]|nr:MAG: phenylacetic acid degradation protein [Bacteroidota bacterium]
MSQYYKLTISDIRSETPSAVVIELSVPENLNESFRFEAGQYLGVRVDIDGTDVRRSYSICSAPTENILRIGVKKVPGGLFSTYANDVLKVGDELEVMPPLGKFTMSCDPARKGQYVFFASGSGITPVGSLVKSILREEPLSHVTLFYGNKTIEDIMFREELDGLKNNYMKRLSVHHILSRERQNSPFYNGRIDAEKCDTFSKVFFIPAKVDKFFLCGPEAMINDVSDWLKRKNIEAGNIAFELFTSPTSRAFVSDKDSKKVLANPERESVVTVRIDGDAMEFNLAYGAENILDAAIAAGADAPFSCKGGVCCTCKAMLMDGEVEMDVVYGLEPDEIEDGYILTCQSHPRSETVLVDYDV